MKIGNLLRRKEGEKTKKRRRSYVMSVTRLDISDMNVPTSTSFLKGKKRKK